MSTSSTSAGVRLLLLLAAAGLLDGKTATTQPISACLDLALALVAEDQGERTALTVARQLVLYLKRQGGQRQFSVDVSERAALRPCLHPGDGHQSGVLRGGRAHRGRLAGRRAQAAAPTTITDRFGPVVRTVDGLPA